MAGKMLLIAVGLAMSTTAVAGVTVIGNSAARSCFEAADSRTSQTRSGLATCNLALQQEALSGRDLVATYVNRGILRLRGKDLDGAVADFDQAIALDPDQPESYLNKGAALFQRQDAREAVRLFTVALQRETRRPELAHYGRAIAQETLGNVREAWLDYRKARELAPDWSEPQIELQRFRVVDR